MKTCKQCKEEIAERATKCPKCQSYQSWYGDGRLVAFLPLLFLFPIFYYSIYKGFDRPQFEDYQDDILTQIIDQDTIQIEGQLMLNILVEVENKSDKRWENAIYEVRYLSKVGDLLNVEKDSDYQFSLKPNGKSISSVKVPLYEEYKEAVMKLELSMLRYDD